MLERFAGLPDIEDSTLQADDVAPALRDLFKGALPSRFACAATVATH